MSQVKLIQYKGKTIIYADYSEVGNSKEKTLELINEIITAYSANPKGTVLGLTNVGNIKFDMDVLKVFKEAQDKTAPYEKKVAVYGVKGLLKAGYNFVVGLTNQKYKAFDDELAAKEWLVND